MTRRVVITGYGLISPIGNNPEKFWRSLEDGQSGIELLQSIPPEHLPSKYGGEARDFSGQIGHTTGLPPFTSMIAPQM